jgi:hypothetical protein
MCIYTHVWYIYISYHIISYYIIIDIIRYIYKKKSVHLWSPGSVLTRSHLCWPRSIVNP